MEGFAKHVSIFDAVRSISEHIRDKSIVPVEFCGPGFLARGLKHPLIPNCIGNDISLADATKNIVLTGANASGKSTILRSIALASLMSQTVCVAYSSAIAIKPVYTINSHMCVPDDIIKGKSRFQAEMANIGEIVAIAEKNKPCLIVIDELFSSTTASQCVVCLDGVLRRISDFKHCMFVLATHHDVDFDGVRRYTMKTSSDSFEHKYKMVKGVNNVYNAESTFANFGKT
jgi:DNA mismatch repair ATPase MutS